MGVCFFGIHSYLGVSCFLFFLFCFLSFTCMLGVWRPLSRRPDSMKDPLAKSCVNPNSHDAWVLGFPESGPPGPNVEISLRAPKKASIYTKTILFRYILSF